MYIITDVKCETSNRHTAERARHAARRSNRETSRIAPGAGGEKGNTAFDFKVITRTQIAKNECTDGTHTHPHSETQEPLSCGRPRPAAGRLTAAVVPGTPCGRQSSASHLGHPTHTYCCNDVHLVAFRTPLKKERFDILGTKIIVIFLGVLS